MDRLVALNKEYVNRRVHFGPDQRFNASSVVRHVNQHTKASFAVQMDHAYMSLVKATTVSWAPDAMPELACWIVDDGTSGFHYNEHGYVRLNFDRSKVFAHCFSWLYHHPGMPIIHDISHLCGKRACCRPKHLAQEDREANISRNQCLGWAISNQSGIRIPIMCVHEPRCLRWAWFHDDDIIFSEVEQD